MNTNLIMQKIDFIAPKIYVACLAAYTNGHLHGCWIDLLEGHENALQSINTMLMDSPIPGAEEWAIHDQEGFYSYNTQEYESLEDLCEIAKYIEKYGEVFCDLLVDYIPDVAIEMIEEDYIGSFDCEMDFIYDYVESQNLLHNVDKNVAMYFDHDAYLHDLINDGKIGSYRIKGKFHFFNLY
jgi:antirestriction protein